MDPKKYRLAIGGLTIALVALIAVLAVIIPRGESESLPGPIEDLFPRPGDSVVRQTGIEVDLPIGYVLDLEVDGVQIPPTELVFTEATGLWFWEPKPGHVLEEWPDGSHTASIRWDRTAGGGPDPGEFTWTFMVQ